MQVLPGKGVVAVAVVLLALGGCASSAQSDAATPSVPLASSAAPTQPTTVPEAATPMTASEAGERYLALVCPTNELIEAWDLTNEQLPASETLADVQVDLAREIADSFESQARGLADPEFVWPANVAADVSDRAVAAFERAAIYRQMADGGTWQYASGALDDRLNTSASRIRLQLGLSTRGEDCPS